MIRDRLGHFMSADPELRVAHILVEELTPLDQKAQRRVIDWLWDRYVVRPPTIQQGPCTYRDHRTMEVCAKLPSDPVHPQEGERMPIGGHVWRRESPR